MASVCRRSIHAIGDPLAPAIIVLGPNAFSTGARHNARMDFWPVLIPVGALICFAAGWALSRIPRLAPEVEEARLLRENEALRDEIWELKGAAAERDKAEAANEAKSRFLATVSHEMRTPLNGILGMADLAKGENLTAEQQYYLEMIRASGGALANLIEEVLDFSKIEAGKIDLVEEPFDVTPLVERVVELLAPRAQGKGLEIASAIAPDVPPTLVGDAARLQQVLINLVGNAVKFTDSGGVGLRVTKAGGGVIRFAISDTGPGIPLGQQEAVFQDFEQADGSSTRRHEGTGLGLAISRRIAERMSGSLKLAHSDQSGSIFVCELPLDRMRAQASMQSDRPALAGKRVLVAANSAFEGPYLGERLATAGASVTRAEGEEAALAELSKMPHFDIVIVDCALGEDVTRRLAGAARAAGAGRSMVLFSPFERRTFGQASLQAFDGWLVKPVRTGSLISRLTDAFANGSLTRDNPAEPVRSAAGLRVLLAEDNDINALIATKHLQKIGAVVERARDGQEALAFGMAALEGAREAFDVLLLDIRMPGHDGIEVARRLRAAESAAGKPRVRMVALTANAYDEDRRACLAAGIDAFLTKPVDIGRLAQAVAPPPHALLDEREARR